MSKNFARKATKSKQQTQISFQSLEQSSPAAPSSSGGLQPANVCYELPGSAGTPMKYKKIIASESDDILSSDIMNNVRSSAARRSTRNLPQKAFLTPSKSQPQFTSGFLDESEDNGTATNPAPSHRSMMHKKRTRFIPGCEAYKRRALNNAESSEGSEPEEQNITLSKKSAMEQEKIIEQMTFSSDSGSDSDADITALATKKKMVSKVSPRRSTRNAITKPETITLDSDDDLALPPPKSTRGKVSKPPWSFQRSSSASKLIDEDEDDDDPIVSSPKRSQRPIFKKKVDTSESEAEEDEIQSSSRRRPRLEAIPAPTDDEEQGEEGVPVSPLKRRRLVDSESELDGVESPVKRRRNTQSSKDSSSDLNLPISSRRQRPAHSSESPQRVTRQARTRRHRTEKEKTLELIKRKRAGEKISQLTDTESSDDDEDEPDFEELSEFDDEDEDEVVKPRTPGKKAAATGDVEDDDDFIVDDDEDDPLGVPMHMIPLEFTHQAHKPLKEHFRDAVEWMVHKKLNPAFPKDDPIYDQAFRKLETECLGLAKSKFSSTAWTTAFTHALYARPSFVSGDLEEGEGYDLVTGLPKCDACNHRSHVPSKFIQFQGKAYAKNSLDEIDQSTEDSDGYEWDSDDSDRVEVNEKGLKLPAEKTKWFVGRHCFANAENSHTLIHWRFSLYEWVKDTLENEGELLPAKLSQRENMKAKQRTKYANDLVDRWAAADQIKDLYRDFKNQVATARDLQQGKRGAWV